MNTKVLDAIVALCLVMFAGLMAGLTMGAVSLDPTYLEILKKTGTPEQKRQAARLSPFVQRHHLVLVTLLISNSAANEALPLFIDNIVPEWVAVILSVSLVLLFGEVLPSAIFTGPKQLALTSSLAWLLWILVFVFGIIAWPIAKVLDWVLGDEHGPTRYRRNELKAFLSMHLEDQGHGDGNGGHGSGSGGYGGGINDSGGDKVPAGPSSPLSQGTPGQPLLLPAMRRSSSIRTMKSRMTVHKLNETTDAQSALAEVGGRAASATAGGAAGLFLTTPGVGGEQAENAITSHLLTTDEVAIMSGALELKLNTVGGAMIALQYLFMVSTEQRMDEALMTEILQSTHSRVPVYMGSNRNALVGMIIVKTMIKLDPEDAVSVSTLPLVRPPVVHPDLSLLDCLNVMQESRAHMCLVSPDAPKPNSGTHYVTLPDQAGSVRVFGALTLEDVVERLIQEPIYDETDAVRPVNGQPRPAPIVAQASITGTPASVNTTPVVVAVEEEQKQERTHLLTATPPRADYNALDG